MKLALLRLDTGRKSSEKQFLKFRLLSLSNQFESIDNAHEASFVEAHTSPLSEVRKPGRPQVKEEGPVGPTSFLFLFSAPVPL
jgi:hypothetical protein